MRTVPLVFLAAALSTQLVLGAPLVETRPRSESLSTNKSYYRISRLDTRASQLIDNPALRTVGVAKAPEGSAGPDSSSSKQLPQEKQDYSDDYKYDNMKRAGDDETAGGNAYTGNSGNVSSGDIYNLAGSDSTITNASGNNVGIAGQSVTGDARGGEGKGRGPGGNAYTGNSGDANGGTIHNDAGIVQNMANTNNAGQGGVSESGVATGGGN